LFRPPKRARARRSLRPAALAPGWRIARRGKGIEMAHFQIVHTGVTLAVCSRLRPDGFIEIELGIGDPRQAARVIPAAQLQRARLRPVPRQPARRYGGLSGAASLSPPHPHVH